MPLNWDEFTLDDHWLDQYVQPQKKERRNSSNSIVSDFGHAVASGINETAALPFWLAEKAGIESAGAVKDYFLNSAEKKREGYSPAMKEAQQKRFIVQQEDGSYAPGEAWDSPRKLLGVVGESLPGMIGGMGLSSLAAKGLMKAGMSRGLSWAIGSSLGEGSITGAQDAMNVDEVIRRMPEEKLLQSPEYRALLEKLQDSSKARKQLSNDVALATGIKTGISTGLLSAPSGMAFGKMLGGEGGKTLWSKVSRQAVSEAAEEALQSGVEEYVSQTELKRADPSVNPMENVWEASLVGGLTGKIMGVGTGTYAHVMGEKGEVRPGEVRLPQTNTKPGETPKKSEEYFADAEVPQTDNPLAPNAPISEKFISPWRDKTTQTQYPPVIRSDQPVDLLSFNDNTPIAGLAGSEKNTSPNSRAGLPEDYIDADYSVLSEGQGAFPSLPQHQLPAGTGRQSGFKGAPPEAPLQGLSFLASPQMYQPQPEMPSTFPLPGNVGGRPGPQFSPTGGVPQLTPRADTTSQALALGVAAPDMMPVPHRGLMNLPLIRRGTSTAPVNTPQLPSPPTVTQPQKFVEPEFTPSSSSSPAQPILESPVSPRPTPNITRAMAMAQRLQSGAMTPEELRIVYEAYRRNHPTLAQELSLMSRSNLLSWVPPDMKRAARRSKRQKIAQMLLEYMDGLFLRPDILSSNLKEENNSARSEEQNRGTETQGAIAQFGLEPNNSQPNEQSSVVMGNREGRQGRAGHNAATPPARTRIAIPNRGKADVTYEIVEADAIKTSHLPSAGFQKNPAYTLENERRYHDEPASQAKVMENAAQLDPVFLMDSVDANHGAPVIDQEGNVLGGNGRAMSISRAYESFPERGKQYREALKAKAGKLGLDPSQVDAMRSPVLVRRLDRSLSPEERQQLVTAMNDDFKASREKKAEGKTRGDRLSPATIDALAKGLRDTDSLRQFFDTPESASVVERLLADGVIQPSERNAYIGADGLLNPDGKAVVEAAVRGRIARNYETLAQLPADIQGKLDAAIPHILVAEGVGGEWNITEHVRDAVDLLAEYKKSGIKEPVIFLKQVNMLTGTAPIQSASKESIAIFQMALQGKKSEFAKAFTQYASEAKRSPEAGGIPGVAKTQAKAFQDAFGMEPEPSPAKPKKKEEGKPQTKERPKEQPPQLPKKSGEEGSKKNVVFSSGETGLQVLPNSSLTPKKMEGNDGRDLRSQSRGKSLVEDASGIPDGQRTAAIVQDVRGVEGSSSGTSGRNDSKGSASEPQNGRDSKGHPARDNHGTALPVRGSELGRGTSYGGTERENMGVGGGSRKLSADPGRRRKTRDNHHIAPDDVLVPGGTVARAKANIEAVRLLKKLDVEKRGATPEEKKLLAQFTGWGSLAQEVFNADYAYAAQYEKRLDGALPPALRYADDKKRSDYARWKKNYGEALHPDLGGMMTAQEWDAAEKSTLNAHYTDRKVIEALWGMAEKLGFRGGRVLEPSAGTGLFFGLMPEHLSDRSSLVGVELDTLTGGILGKLYPDADIQVTGFENAKRVGDNTLDLVISNVPFGNFRVTDRKRPQYAKQSIHNYFISRSIDAARPGGLVMEITSHFTMDSLSGASIREEWGRKADLVAAIRLPGTAFEKNAGTQVTTDILIFRKKDSGLSPVSNAFRNVENVETPDGPATVNEYFVQHPEMVLGEHSLQGSMYGENEYTLKPRAGERLEDGLKRALKALPANVFGEGRTAPVEREQGIADAGMREGALVEKEGTLFTVADGALIPPEWADKPRKVKQAKSYVGVKQSVFDLINAMNSDAAESEIEKLRARLNAVYDAYVKEYGPINKNGNGFLEDDIEFPTVAAIESTVSVPVTKTYKSGKRKGESYQVDEKRVTKADIFDKRTIFPFREPTSAENVQDAIKISRIFKTGIDVGYVGKLLGMGPEAARAELLKSENVFENPETGLIEPDDVYLSGNVRKKLEMAEARREDNPAYEKNVEALRKVQPDRIGIDAIHARLGSSWVPAEVYKGFVEHLGFSGVAVEKVRLEGEEGSTQWDVEAYGGTPEARNRWGVDGASALDLISDGLNMKRTEIYDETYGADGKPSRVKNTEKTLAAQEKQRAIQNEFQSWLKKDDAAGKLVEDEYNDTFNGFVPRKFTAPDIKHFPGASHAIELRENQKIGVVRGLQESTLLAHGVGSGKTMLQITLAMEMRRLGTAKKPWIVVQASTLSQFAATFKTLYPRANILAPTEKQRNAKNRQRLLAQIASGDWDAVVTPHGFFNSISIDPQNEARFIEAQIEEYKDSLRTDFNVEDIDKKKSSESRTVKQIRKKIEKLRNRLEALSNTRKDENIYFEQLGVDALIIDEAHVYKRGSFYTKMDNVKGLDRDSSQRSMQMLMKARHVQAKTGGKNVVLATGTPISNTLTEMWTMFRYTRPDLLKEFGVEQFDDFASAFADTSVDLEETATGEFKQVERFNKFVNGPELLTLWRSGADVALTEDLDYIKGLPKLKEGRIHEVTVERSESLSNYIEALRQERAEWDRLSGKEKREQSSVPLQIYGKAKKAAIDLRLVDSTLPDEPVSKANKAVENIHDRWEENRDTKAAQIVFCDNFRSGDGAFNLFEDIKGKLIARGVPKGEIAIIHDFKTDEARKRLFDAVNRGDVRILMGTTEKLGVGVNVQERLLTAHHLDAPPRPMDFEQRNGRIRRPGNIFPEVEILTYGTRNTLDSVTFQQLISKQKFINQLLRGDVGTRSFENPFDATQATFEDMMAAFSGNPLAKEKMQLQVEVRRLEALNAAYESRLGTLRHNLRSAKSSLAFFEGRTKSAEAVTAFIKDHFPDGEIEGRKELSKEVSGWLDAETKRIEKALSGIKRYAQWQVKNPADNAAGRTVDLGNGVSAEVSLLPSVTQAQDGTLVKGVSMSYQLAGPHGIKEAGPFNGAVGLFTRLRNDLARYAGSAAENAAKIKGTKAQIASLEEELKRPFEQKKELEDAHERMAEIEQKLAETSRLEAEETPKASLKADSTPVAVVDVDPGIVPEFGKMRELARWLKDYFADKRMETILSTGKVVRFGNGNLEASMKRSRERAHGKAYGGLHDLIRLAEYDSYEAQDVRHPNLGGQEVYYSAMRLDGKLYAIKFKFDVPSEEEFSFRKERRGETEVEDLRYKDHSLREIEIAPVLYRGGVPEGRPTQTLGAIREISLGVLRDAVKPSRLENGVLFSVKPGEFLNEVPPSRLRVRKAAVQFVADALGKRAANAAETRVVQSFEELPEHIRRLYGDAAARLEGVYDPATATVYLVADNLRSTGRAAEVWMHENMVHHGLNGLLGKGEKRRILNRLWQGMSGLGNADLKEIAHRYGVDPRSDAEARELVMEEYVANLAEKRAGDKLSGKDQTYWRRFVEAVLRAWNAVVDFVAGRTSTMRYENLDRLLAALDRYVFEGKPDGTREQGSMASAMESRRADPNNARFSPDTGKATDFVTLPDGSIDFAQFPETRLIDYRLMKAAPVRLQRGRHSPAGGNFGLRHIEANHGEDIRKAGYQNVQEFIWDLVNNFDEIWQGEGKSVLLVKKNTNTQKIAGFIRLEKTGEFYSVSTAFPADLGYPNQKTRKKLWSRDQHATPTTGEQAPFNPFRAFRNPIQGQTGNLQGQRGQSTKNVQHGGIEGKLKASLRDIESVKDIIGLSAKDALNIASNDPHIGKFFSRPEDVTLLQRIFMLPHWLAKKYPNFKTVYERQIRRMDERAAEVASSLQEVPSLFDGNNLSKEDMAQLNKLVWDNDGRQIAELEEIDKFLTNEKLDNGRTTITTNPEWYEGYEEWLGKQPVSEPVKKAMREIRMSLDSDLVRAHNRLAEMSEMNDGIIQGFRTQIWHIHNYFPHHRYGDYYIQGKDKDGNVVYREHFDALNTMKARQHAFERLEELKKEYPDAVFDSGKNTKLPDEAFGRIIDPEAMEQIIKAALAKVSDKEQASKIAEVLYESVADVIKSTGWGSHTIRRKNIPGFEKDDLYRVLYDYKSGLSGWLTKMEASRDFATALSNINAKTNPNEWSYASQYVKDMLRNSDAIDRGVGKVKTLAFAWYLGANLKTAVVNLTQNIIIGVPRLEMDVTSGARYYIRGAQKQVVNQLDRRFHDKNSGKGLSEEEAQLINELYGDSVITDAYMEEVRGHMSGGKNARMWNKLMKFMGYPMSVAERFNRGSLALAAFRAAREGKLKPAARRRYGVDENGIATYEQAKAFAEDVVRDSHYVYGKSNAPELLRSSAAGRGLGAAFTFKTFTANTVGLWYWALTTQGMEGAKMVGKGLAATVAMGGLVSLPLYTTLQALAQTLSGDDDDWTETIRRNLPQDDLLRDVVCYGLPASVGVNLGGSLKMELALTRGMQRGSTPKEVLTEGIGDIIGIPWDLFIEKPSKVMDAVRVDNTWRAVESMTPALVSNAMKGYRLVTEGQKTLKGKDINEPGQKGPRKLTEVEGLGMLLGFQPVSNTKSYDSYNAREHAEKIRSEKIGEVALKMLKAKEADDLAGMAAAKRILLEWNKKMESENKPWMKFALKDMKRRMVALRRDRSLSKRQRPLQKMQEAVW